VSNGQSMPTHDTLTRVHSDWGDRPSMK